MDNDRDDAQGRQETTPFGRPPGRPAAERPGQPDPAPSTGSTAQGQQPGADRPSWSGRQDQSGPTAYRQSPYEQSPYEQPRYEQPRYGRSEPGPSHQGQYEQGQYGQPRYGQGQYEQGQYGQPRYGQEQYGQGQYGQPRYGQDQYQQGQYGQDQYGQGQYKQYAQGQYAQGQYGQGQYGRGEYAQGQYVPSPYEQQPGQFSGQERPARPGTVITAAVLALVHAALGLLVTVGLFAGGALIDDLADVLESDPSLDTGTTAGVDDVRAVLVGIALLALAWTVVMVWGAVLALRGRSRVLLLVGSSIAVACTGLVLLFGLIGIALEPQPSGDLGSVVLLVALFAAALAMLVLLCLRSSGQFFAAHRRRRELTRR
ncbi:hypothetical protein [Modestobacter lacusdianchii]